MEAFGLKKDEIGVVKTNDIMYVLLMIGKKRIEELLLMENNLYAPRFNYYYSV